MTDLERGLAEVEAHAAAQRAKTTKDVAAGDSMSVVLQKVFARVERQRRMDAEVVEVKRFSTDG